MTLPTIIGLNGVARSGKDTIAGILRDLYGYEVLSFSKALNDALVILNPIVDVAPQSGPGWGGYTVTRYADVMRDEGYEDAKERHEVRRLLQVMGTDVGRNMFGKDVWVDALFADLPPGKLIVLSNMRFPNEYQAVKDMGGEAWFVHRPGFEPAQGHISDTALDGYQFDRSFYNDSSISALADKVMDALAGNATLDVAPALRALQNAHNTGARA